MSGPQNAVVGDADFGTSLPVTDVPQEVLEEEIKLAKYSQTAEFKRLKNFMEARIQFHQRYLPSGARVQGDPATKGLQVNLPQPDMTPHWIAACIVISEFENILAEYAQAKEAVDGRAAS